MKLSPGNGVRGLLPDGDRAEDRINVFKTKTEGNIMKLKKVMALTMAGAMAATTLTACADRTSFLCCDAKPALFIFVALNLTKSCLLQP